jgi:hypothetical protein
VEEFSKKLGYGYNFRKIFRNENIASQEQYDDG